MVMGLGPSGDGRHLIVEKMRFLRKTAGNSLLEHKRYEETTYNRIENGHTGFNM
jgi:hypothetical protein